MQQSQAIEMLSIHGGFTSKKQNWVDLGAGSGTFTLALAYHLGPESHILAVDKDRSALNNIPVQVKNVNIEKRDADFADIDFSSNSLDGILMANSLHYVQHQGVFIEKMKTFLKSDGCFLIVEYDTNRSNPWIPYPVSFDRLHSLFSKEDFPSIKKINEKPSRYNKANLYSAIIRKPQLNS